MSHSKEAQNNNNTLKLPSGKLEVVKQRFYFGGAKLYTFPLDLWLISDFDQFQPGSGDGDIIE